MSLLMTAFVITCLSSCRSKVFSTLLKLGGSRNLSFELSVDRPLSLWCILRNIWRIKRQVILLEDFWRSGPFHLLGTNWWRHAILFFHFLSLAKSFLHRLHFTAWTTQQIFLSLQHLSKERKSSSPFFVSSQSKFLRRSQKEWKSSQEWKRHNQRREKEIHRDYNAWWRWQWITVLADN